MEQPINNNNTEQTQDITSGKDRNFEGGEMFLFSLTQKDLVPKFIEKEGVDYVFYGDKNTYPLMLIDLINSEPLHRSIFNTTVQQACGKSIRIKDGKKNIELEKFLANCNKKGESLYKVTQKLIYDYVLFNGFSSSIMYRDFDNKFDIFHTDFSTLRSGKPEDVTGYIDKYYFANDWTKFDVKPKPVQSFNSENKKGLQVHYFNKYASNSVVYPTPRYAGSIGWILLSIKVCEFFNSYLESGCFPSLMVTLMEGKPDRDKARAIIQQFMSQFGGSARAGKILFNFVNSLEEKPAIDTIQSNNDDKKFEHISQLFKDMIIAGWQINPELAQLPVGGRLGNSTLLESQLLFNRNVIEPIQTDINEELNFLLKANGFTDEVEIEPLKTIVALSEETGRKIYTINELRERDGAKPAEFGGDVFVDSGKSAVKEDSTSTDENKNTMTDKVDIQKPTAEEKIATNQN